jgi:hypothetical protein
MLLWYLLQHRAYSIRESDRDISVLYWDLGRLGCSNTYNIMVKGGVRTMVGFSKGPIMASPGGNTKITQPWHKCQSQGEREGGKKWEEKISQARGAWGNKNRRHAIWTLSYIDSYHRILMELLHFHAPTLPTHALILITSSGVNPGSPISTFGIQSRDFRTMNPDFGQILNGSTQSLPKLDKITSFYGITITFL